MVQFIAMLSLEGLSYSTAKLYIAGIGYYCKIKGNNDVTKHFIVSKILEGLKRSSNSPGSSSDSRLPVTVSLLTKVVAILPAICTNLFESKLFKAAYCLAFFGVFRVGELTTTRACYVHRIISIGDKL